MKLLFYIILFIVIAPMLCAQDIFEKHIFSEGTDSINYRFLAPFQQNSNNNYPLVISLHGAGERGFDNEKQLVYIKKLFLDSLNRIKYPCFIFAPQCPPEPMRWSMTDRHKEPVVFPNEPSIPMKLVLKIISEIKSRYPVDDSRIYITGLSQGGCGTYDILIRNPKMFAAAAPICGWTDTSKAYIIKDIPIWIFHGDSDNIVLPKHSRDMAVALKNAGGNPKYTEYHNVNHGSWINAYKEPDFLEWMFSQRKK